MAPTPTAHEVAARAAAARWRWPVIIAAVVLLLLDQWSKAVVVEHLASPAHPLVVHADGTASVHDLLTARGLDDSEITGALSSRLIWRYGQAKDLKATTDLSASGAPHQLIATAGTGFPAPRRLRVRLRDRDRPLGELLVDRWRVAEDDVATVLAQHTWRGEDAVRSPTFVPAKGELVAVLHREQVWIDGFMKMVYAENPGAAWGFLRDASATFRVAFFSLIGLIASLGMIWAIWTGWMGSTLSTWALGGILGGAVGNLIDRNRYQVVIDFVLNYVGEHQWPVYNVADIGISVGVFLILAELLLRRSPSPSVADEAATS